MNIIEFGWIFPNLPEEPADVGGGAFAGFSAAARIKYLLCTKKINQMVLFVLWKEEMRDSQL